MVPAPLPGRIRRAVQTTAVKAFKAVGCQVYGRVDLILNRKGKISLLEVNTIPGMTSVSLLPDAAKAVGLGFDKLVERIIFLSLKKHKRRIS